MADTLDCNELKAIVLLNVPTNLSVGEPRSPEVNNRPVQDLNPSFGAISSDCAIGVARVEHQAVLVTENLVDPH